MRGWTALLIPTLVVAAALAGCVTVPTAPLADADAAALDSSRAAAVEDAAGDAREMGPRSLAARAACMLGEAACAAATSSPAPEGEYAPHFDLLRAAFEGESADAIVIGLDVASLAEDGAWLAGPLGAHRVASYVACWTPGDDWGDRCVQLTAAPGPEGLQSSASFFIFSAACNEWAYCEWEVPADLTFGEPASVRFVVPKAYAAWDGAPPVVLGLQAAARWSLPNPASPAWHTAATVYGPDRHFHQHAGGVGGHGELADATDALAGEGAWTAAATPVPAPAREGPSLVSPPGNALGRGSVMDRPHLDLLAVDLREEGDEIVIAFTVAEMQALPEHAMHYMVILGIEGKEVYEMGFLKEGLRAYGYAGHCISYECGGDFGGHAHDMEGHYVERLPFDIEPGAPATLTVRAPLSIFPTIAAGDRTNLLWAVSMYSDANVYFGQYGEEVHGDWHKMSFVDERLGGLPFTFERGNPDAVGHDGH